MKELQHELDTEQYKAELASLRRIVVQLNDLRKWLLNVSLASLAFAFTIMLKAKEGSYIPHETLATFTLVFLILSVIGAILIRGKYEFDNCITDSISFSKLLPEFRHLITKSPEISQSEKDELIGYLDRAIVHYEKHKNEKSGLASSLRADLVLIVAELLFFILGLGCLCLYLWQFLFNV
ncbi:hypothetical protein [Celerinatantimonas diazotrophica]|uniref:Uncharacterized protein n=1 Tax=Celerinatantimonas diazotrophica TaxID=412034 RepID=A0A4R1J9H2_9GAMM|nr:hypothetical protein [Celerinatantimonas diazotrophica]TCK47160.1 hypothetical protein EV690_2860 [Celerinatantimonas diazotrophica]CAG9295932.1 hypothetical protein CEDIAZO_01066 [Celerinatantimonas diazotrophica]